MPGMMLDVREVLPGLLYTPMPQVHTCHIHVHARVYMYMYMYVCVRVIGHNSQISIK